MMGTQRLSADKTCIKPGPRGNKMLVDGEYLLINTAERRTKERNMKARPKVAMVIQDPGDPYRYLGMRGEIVSYTNEGADEHINTLSLRYDGKPFNIPAGQRRIIFRIKPTHFDEH